MDTRGLAGGYLGNANRAVSGKARERAGGGAARDTSVRLVALSLPAAPKIVSGPGLGSRIDRNPLLDLSFSPVRPLSRSYVGRSRGVAQFAGKKEIGAYSCTIVERGESSNREGRELKNWTDLSIHFCD